MTNRPPFWMAPQPYSSMDEPPLKFEEYSDFQKKCYRALTNIYLSVGGVQYTNTWKEVYGSPDREHRGRPSSSFGEIKDSDISYEKFLDDFETIQDALGISLFQDPSDVDYADGDYISRFPSPWYRTFEKEGEIGTYIEYFH